MKRFFLLISILVANAGAFAQSSQPEIVTFRFLPGDDMFYVRTSEGMADNAARLRELYAFIDKHNKGIVSGEIPIFVDAYSASAGSDRATRHLSFLRANRVKSELILRKGLTEGNFITKNHAMPYTDKQGVVHKDIVVVTIVLPTFPEPPVPIPPKRIEEEVVEGEPPFAMGLPEPVVEEPVAAVSHSSFSVRTNLLYDAMLTPTIGFEWRINDLGIKLDGSWAHWGSSKGRVHKIWLVNPEVRWYLLDARRFYVGAGANIGEANIYKGLANALSKDTGYQGNIYGGGVTVGYNLPLGNTLSMDFNLGLGVTHFKYDTFTVSNEVRVYTGHDLTKNFWGPTQAAVSLVWRICGQK